MMTINLKTLLSKDTIKDYTIQVLTYGIIINSILIWSFYDLANYHVKSNRAIVENIISKEDPIGLKYICDLTDCKSIYNIHTNDKWDGEKQLYTTLSERSDYLIEFDKYRVSKDLNVVFDVPSHSLIIKTNSSDVIQGVIFNYFVINLLFFILFSMIYFKNKYKEKKKQMLAIMGTEGSLRERNMRILTENIHHELNTPVAIIRGTLKKIELESITKKRTNNTCNGCTGTSNDFSQMYYALDQVDTVLQRMSNFKQIKYSNGNKTVSNIVKYSANSMNIYKRSNFKVELSDELNNYNLTGDLGNGDLMNIVSNHLKNSLEAGSDTIIVQCKFIEGKKPHYGVLHIYIIDNGTGIRDRRTGLPLSKKNLNQVFQPYYSTKDSEGNAKKSIKNEKGIKKIWLYIKSYFDSDESNNEIRGIGLYLNKQMLLENGGNLFLKETSEKGTVFDITVPAKESDTLISQKELLKKVLGK